MLRSYFGEPEGEKCGLCDSDAGLDSEVFDTSSADERHGLHAATDFHARPRRRRRGRGGAEAPTSASAPASASTPAAPPPIVFETAIPSDVPAPLPPYDVPAPPDSEQNFDEGLWAAADAGAGDPLAGDAVVDMNDPELALEAPAPAPATDGDGAAAGEDFIAGWGAVRDANIRPYVEWRAGAPVTLPVLAARPQAGGGQGSHSGHHGHGGGGHGGGGERHRFRGGGPGGRFDGGGDRDGGGGGGGRRKRRRGRNRDRERDRRDNHRHRDRERGPRLPGVYNPGGD
jgi:hypothetical protein